MSENREDTKQTAPVVNYRKETEQVVTSYAEASALADTLFAPFGKKDASGSRTTDTVKVRVRVSHYGGKNDFRVVLYKKPAPKLVEAKTKITEEGEEKKQTRPRHRNDRKGNRRRRGGRDVTTSK